MIFSYEEWRGWETPAATVTEKSSVIVSMVRINYGTSARREN